MRGIYWWLVVPSQRAINSENVFIWWRHHALTFVCSVLLNVLASYLKDKSDCTVHSSEMFAESHYKQLSWWRHQMDTFSALLAICAGNSPVPGEFPTQMPVTRSFDAYFDLRPNKRLSKQSRSWWFEAPSRPLWRHRNVEQIFLNIKCAFWHKMRKEALCHVTTKFVYLARNVILPCLTLSLFPH